MAASMAELLGWERLQLGASDGWGAPAPESHPRMGGAAGAVRKSRRCTAAVPVKNPRRRTPAHISRQSPLAATQRRRLWMLPSCARDSRQKTVIVRAPPIR